MFADLPAPSTLALLLAVAAIAGYVRGYAGFGAGLLFMPTASALIGPQLAVAAFFLTDEIISLPLVPNALRKAHWPTVLPTLVFAVIAVPLGTWTLLAVDPVPLRWAAALMIFAMLALLMSGWRNHGQPHFAASAGVGILSGFLGGLFQIAGPPVVTYWMSGPYPPSVVRANLISFFAIASISTAISYWLGGVFTLKAIGLVIILTPVYSAAIWLGAQRFAGTSETTFRRIAYALIAVSAMSSLPVLDPILRG